jgi:alpha-L-fucosidase
MKKGWVIAAGLVMSAMIAQADQLAKPLNYGEMWKKLAEEGRKKYPDQSWPAPKTEAVEAWKDMRFGMFIHWGPVSLKTVEISWSRGQAVPLDVYDNLYKQFNPVKFNADEWASIAKAAGMKYMVLTAKHHDGFCLWNTKYTDYNIMNSPFKRDVVKELAEACRRQGIRFGLYYSPPDWHHPDFPLGGWRGQTVREKYDMDAYETYALNQMRELLENYGPMVTLWNDCPMMGYGFRGVPIIRMARSVQPDILVNDRTGSGGDYGTPEQQIGGFNLKPWESCMTVSSRNQWSWGGNRDGVKDLKTMLGFVISAAGGNGNVLLNVGPTPEGEIAAVQSDRLREMGQWLEKYGESIYATRGGPYKPTKSFACTRRGNTVYLHVLSWDVEKLELPALPMKILKSELLTGGKVEVNQTSKGVTISVAREFQQPIDTIVKLELDGPAKEIAPIQVSAPAQPKPKVVNRTKVKDGEAINAGDLMEAEKAKEAKTK